MRNLVLAAGLAAWTLAGALGASASGTSGDPYGEQCAKCHGDDGRADTPLGRKLEIPSLVGSSWAAQEADAICKALAGSGPHKGALSKLDEAGRAAACLRVKEIAAGE